MFYNPITKEQKTREELKDLLNASIPYDQDNVDGKAGDDWYLLYPSDQPTYDPDTEKLVDGPITKVADKYYTTKVKEPLTEEELEEVADRKMRERKERRNEEVAALKVAHNGILYDANETSQARIARAISAFDDDSTAIEWVDAENVVQNITIADLKAILAKAVQETTRIWVEPYEEES